MFHNNIAKVSEKLNKQNVLQICLDFCIMYMHFYYGEKVNNIFFFF